MCNYQENGQPPGLQIPPKFSGRTGRVAQIRKHDIANGEGIRVSLFVSGCTHNCPGCFNASYQNFQHGEPWNTRHQELLLEALSPAYIAGLTLLGGEPMQNLWLVPIIHQIRAHYPQKTIWVYSGYTFEQIMAHRGRRQLLDLCDVLVDGLFIAAQLDLRLRFRGSANQRIIDLNITRQTGKLQLHPTHFPISDFETPQLDHA